MSPCLRIGRRWLGVRGLAWERVCLAIDGVRYGPIDVTALYMAHGNSEVAINRMVLRSCSTSVVQRSTRRSWKGCATRRKHRKHAHKETEAQPSRADVRANGAGSKNSKHQRTWKGGIQGGKQTHSTLNQPWPPNAGREHSQN